MLAAIIVLLIFLFLTYWFIVNFLKFRLPIFILPFVLLLDKFILGVNHTVHDNLLFTVIIVILRLCRHRKTILHAVLINVLMIFFTLMHEALVIWITAFLFCLFYQYNYQKVDPSSRVSLKLKPLLITS